VRKRGIERDCQKNHVGGGEVVGPCDGKEKNNQEGNRFYHGHGKMCVIKKHSDQRFFSQKGKHNRNSLYGHRDF